MKPIKYLQFLRLPLRVVFIAVLVMAALRAVFVVHHWSYVQPMGLAGLAQAFVLGVRFDLAVLVLGMVPMLLWMSIPLRWAQDPRALRIMASLCALPLLLAVGIGMADMAYFGEVQRHLGVELFRLGADVGAVLEIALTSRLGTTGLGLGLLVGVGLLWWRAVVRTIQAPVLIGVGWQRAVLFLLAALMWLILGRGFVLSGKPIDVLDAFARGEERVAQLALNGAFVVLKTRNDSSGTGVRFMPPKELKALGQRLYPNGQHPFGSSQAQAHLPDRPRHVVVLLMESWTYRYIDSLAGTRHGATPFIDSLVPKAQVWDRFYAAGQRSILGIQAVLTSTPVLNHMPTLGDGLELNRMSRMADLAGAKGYETVMVQTSNRRSFHVESIAKSLGFEHYFGKEDLPLRRQYPQDVPRFGWDYEGLMFLESQITQLHQAQGKPVFAFIFTGTTHEPFADPGAEFHIRPHTEKGENGYLNTLRYSDWAVGEFMAAASKQPWYRDTTFIITADHVLKVGQDMPLPDQFHIPFLVYSPSGEFAPARHQRVAGQYDVLPTLADLMGIAPQQLTTLGRSLFAPKSSLPAQAMVSKGELTGFIGDQQWFLLTDQGQVVDHSGPPSKASMVSAPPDLKHWAWRAQTASCWVKANQWVTGQFTSASGPCANAP